MGTFTRFEDIEAWKAARELNKSIYSISGSGSFAKDFALKEQIRRAAISISSNIAEGFGRNSSKEFKNFLGYASGSANEVQSQLYLALDQGYLTKTDFKSIVEDAERTKKLIGGLIHYLNRN